MHIADCARLQRTTEQARRQAEQESSGKAGKLIGGALSSLLGLAKGRGGQHEFSGVKAFVGDAELAGLAAQCALLRDILGLFQNGVLLMDEVDLV